MSQQPCLVKRLEGHTAGNRLALLSLHQHNPERYPYLLQSVAAGNAQARYDILFAYPGDQLILQPDDVLSLNGELQSDNHFFFFFDQCWHDAATSACANDKTLPFSGGWFVYLSYELVRQIEPGVGRCVLLS